VNPAWVAGLLIALIAFGVAVYARKRVLAQREPEPEPDDTWAWPLDEGLITARDVRKGYEGCDHVAAIRASRRRREGSEV
jgi:hypothetical protein